MIEKEVFMQVEENIKNMRIHIRQEMEILILEFFIRVNEILFSLENISLVTFLQKVAVSQKIIVESL